MMHKLTLALVFLSILLLPSFALAANTFAGDYSTTAPAFAGGVIRRAFCDIVDLMTGQLGGLVLSAFGVMAIGQGAFGDFSGAKAAVVTAIGAFTIAGGVSLYFGDFGCGVESAGNQEQNAGNQGAQGNQQGNPNAGNAANNNNIFGPPVPLDVPLP